MGTLPANRLVGTVLEEPLKTSIGRLPKYSSLLSNVILVSLKPYKVPNG